MKTSSALIIILVFIGISVNEIQANVILPQRKEKVVAREITVTMSTSGCGFRNPETPFLETGGRNSDVCYPVPYNGHILREKPRNVDWRIVVLENEFLRVEFAPELGGMIWRLFDKVHNEDVLHAPGKVFPSSDGFGGTYTAGGLELNYPYAHSVTNTWPRKTEFRENKDGSATYIVSEWERNGRTEWSMEFTLKPGESTLRQEVTLYNRGKSPASFVYWGNARVPANAGTRWLEPEGMASEHGGSTIFTWPVFRGTDISLMANDPEIIGMYFLEPRYNFFGLTNTKTGSGMVHYADYRDLPGKKLWNWGRTPMDGNRKWDGNGSEPHMHGYEYGEVQSGRMVNQDHLEWLMPEECIIWKESWSPIYGLTNVNEVTEDAAFQLLEKEHKLLVYPFTNAPGLKLHCLVNGKEVKEISLPAKTSHLLIIDLPGIAGDSLEKMEIKVEKDGLRAGAITLISRCEQKSADEIKETPVFRELSSESMSTTAEFYHKLLFRKEALSYYQQAIKLDSLNYKAYLGLGKLLYAHADFNGAREQFLQAIKAYKWCGEAYLMLSQIDQLQGNPDAAEDRAYEARYYGEKCRGNLRIGEVLISRGEYGKAIGILEEAIINNARSFRTYALLALCERKMGNSMRALAQLDRAPKGALKDILWYSEAFFAGRLSAAQLEKELFKDEWRFLEVSLDYLLLGSYIDAEKIADAGIALHQKGWELDKLFNPDRIWDFTRKRETPFFYLVKGSVMQHEGRTQEASKYFAEGDYFEQYVNFNQPELVPVMVAAKAAGNGYASLWLGNFYFHSFRYKEAKAEWDIANEKHPGNPLILANLACYTEFQASDLKGSIILLEKALDLNPMDVFIRQRLISVMRSDGAGPDELLKVYLEAPKEQRDGYLFNRGLLQAFEYSGKWNEAAEYLKNVDRRWSNDVRSWYDFCIGFAENLLKESKPQEALQWIAKSSPTPANLSDINLPAEFFYRQREFFIAAQAYKNMGKASESQEFFRKVIDEQTDFMFNAGDEMKLARLRFYTALSMKELGMEPAGRGLLVGINACRLKSGLVTLKLDNSELEKWNTKDPLSKPSSAE